MQSLNEELLKVLSCPWTREKLSLLNDEELRSVNQKIADGQCKQKSGDAVSNSLEAALRNEGFNLVYRMEDGISDLLPDNAIVL